MVKLPDPQTATSLLLTSLAARLARVLKDRCWKKTAFAHGRVSANTVRNVLHGKDHRVSTLAALADALDCDLVIDIHPRNQQADRADHAQHIAHES